MPMHSWGQIFWDRIHHHFKCKASQNPTKDSWAIYKISTSFKNKNMVDGMTDLQDVVEMDDDGEEEDDEDKEEEDENESEMDNSNIDN